MRTTPTVALAALLLAPVLASCASTREPTHNQAERIESQVLARVRAMEQHERDLNADAILELIGPEFYMYQDGRRVGRDEVIQQIAQTIPTLRAFDARFDDVEVTALSHDTALVTFVFHDAITTADGDTSRKWGPNTMIWRLDNNAWRLFYVDADHYPEP